MDFASDESEIDMSIDAVKEFLRERGFSGNVIEHEKSTATVAKAAEALNVPEACIAQSLVVRLGKSEDEAVLVVMCGTSRLDNAKFKARFGKKANMPDADEVLALTGHPAGGLCPFALARPIPIYMDVSLKELAVIYPAAGTLNSCIETTPQELQRLTRAQWVDVCK